MVGREGGYPLVPGTRAPHSPPPHIIPICMHACVLVRTSLVLPSSSNHPVLPMPISFSNTLQPLGKPFMEHHRRQPQGHNGDGRPRHQRGSADPQRHGPVQGMGVSPTAGRMEGRKLSVPACACVCVAPKRTPRDRAVSVPE